MIHCFRSFTYSMLKNMKNNQNRKAGKFQRGTKQNDKFFKINKGDNKFKSAKKDQKVFSNRNNNKNRNLEFNKKNHEKKKQLSFQQSRRPEDKGGYRQYANPDRNSTKVLNVNRKPYQSARSNGNENNNSFNKQPKNFMKNNTKKKNTPIGSDEEGLEVETESVINFCVAPNLLEEMLKKKKTKQPVKVDKREEYLKQKQRRNEILKQKTRKGQPVMAGRMQLLYEKVQKVIAKENESK
uniref:CSON003429 protein n=1 Tax=Culicoides sonorensis TaxID=179676 RepID=A0A336MQZ8_CULSO